MEVSTCLEGSQTVSTYSAKVSWPGEWSCQAQEAKLRLTWTWRPATVRGVSGCGSPGVLPLSVTHSGCRQDVQIRFSTRRGRPRSLDRGGPRCLVTRDL